MNNQMYLVLSFVCLGSRRQVAVLCSATWFCCYVRCPLTAEANIIFCFFKILINNLPLSLWSGWTGLNQTWQRWCSWPLERLCSKVVIELTHVGEKWRGGKQVQKYRYFSQPTIVCWRVFFNIADELHQQFNFSKLFSVKFFIFYKLPLQFPSGLKFYMLCYILFLNGVQAAGVVLQVAQPRRRGRLSQWDGRIVETTNSLFFSEFSDSESLRPQVFSPSLLVRECVRWGRIFGKMSGVCPPFSYLPIKEYRWFFCRGSAVRGFPIPIPITPATYSPHRYIINHQ